MVKFGFGNSLLGKIGRILAGTGLIASSYLFSGEPVFGVEAPVLNEPAKTEKKDEPKTEKKGEPKIEKERKEQYNKFGLEFRAGGKLPERDDIRNRGEIRASYQHNDAEIFLNGIYDERKKESSKDKIYLGDVGLKFSKDGWEKTELSLGGGVEKYSLTGRKITSELVADSNPFTRTDDEKMNDKEKKEKISGSFKRDTLSYVFNLDGAYTKTTGEYERKITTDIDFQDPNIPDQRILTDARAKTKLREGILYGILGEKLYGNKLSGSIGLIGRAVIGDAEINENVNGNNKREGSDYFVLSPGVRGGIRADNLIINAKALGNASHNADLSNNELYEAYASIILGKRYSSINGFAGALHGDFRGGKAAGGAALLYALDDLSASIKTLEEFIELREQQKIAPGLDFEIKKASERRKGLSSILKSNAIVLGGEYRQGNEWNAYGGFGYEGFELNGLYGHSKSNKQLETNLWLPLTDERTGPRLGFFGIMNENKFGKNKRDYCGGIQFSINFGGKKDGKE